jgi:hypothetical protein
MKKKLSTIAYTLLTAISLNVNAALVITYTGTLSYQGAPAGQESGDDFAGLDGASFIFTGTFDETATRFNTNGDGFDEFLGVSSLNIVNTQSGLDGEYNAQYNTLGEVTHPTADYYLMPSYVIQDFTLFLDNLQVAKGFTGASSPTNTVTPFNTSDLASNSASVTVQRSGYSDAVYFVSDLNVTSEASEVPVPAAIGLFGIGALGLYGLARRRKNKM